MSPAVVHISLSPQALLLLSCYNENIVGAANDNAIKSCVGSSQELKPESLVRWTQYCGKLYPEQAIRVSTIFNLCLILVRSLRVMPAFLLAAWKLFSNMSNYDVIGSKVGIN